MTELHRTDDEIGVDLNELRLLSSVATLGTKAPQVRLPSREHDGFAAIDLSDSDRQAALKELGVDTAAGAALASHAKLDMRRGYVAGKGHLNLIRFSHVWCEQPRADWVSWLDVAGIGGIVEMWFKGLTANKQYLISIAVSGWANTGNAPFKGFKVGSSGGFYANFPVASSGQTQYLYGLLKPTSDLMLVRLEQIQLELLSFYNTELWPL
jgi:hypothetical protein